MNTIFVQCLLKQRSETVAFLSVCVREQVHIFMGAPEPAITGPDVIL